MALSILEEQEKLDELKAWWDRWGNLVSFAIAGVLVGRGRLAAGGRIIRPRETAEAATIYDKLDAVAAANDAKGGTAKSGAMLIDKYAGHRLCPAGCAASGRVNREPER